MADFVPKDFLRNLKPELLEEYCEKRSIDFKARKDEKAEEQAKRFLKIWQSLEPSKSNTVEAEFHSVNDMASQNGVLNLMDEAAKEGVVFSEKEEAFEKGGRNIAFWFFLNHEKVFNEAAVRFEIMDRMGWSDIGIPEKRNLDYIRNKENVLADAIQKYYEVKELRHSRCEVEYYDIDGLACFVAYPEDFAEPAIEYDKTGKLNKHNAIKPVLKIFFLYDPDKGRLSVKARGGSAVVKKLQGIFASTVLGQELDTSRDKIFNLNILKNFNFTFPTPPADEVEFVRVKSLRLSYPATSGKRIVLEVSSEGQYGLDALKRFINELAIPVQELYITQAVIQVKFKPPAKRMKGTVTVQLTHPNASTLGYKNLHRKVKQYLKDWGIDNGT